MGAGNSVRSGSLCLPQGKSELVKQLGIPGQERQCHCSGTVLGRSHWQGHLCRKSPNISSVGCFRTVIATAINAGNSRSSLEWRISEVQLCLLWMWTNAAWGRQLKFSVGTRVVAVVPTSATCWVKVPNAQVTPQSIYTGVSGAASRNLLPKDSVIPVFHWGWKWLFLHVDQVHDQVLFCACKELKTYFVFLLYLGLF